MVVLFSFFLKLLFLFSFQGKQCPTCAGQKVVRERKTFDVNIKPGTPSNSKLLLRGESNQRPGVKPGDVCLVINEKPHPLFRREGNDLVYEHHLTVARVLFIYSAIGVGSEIA